MTLNDNNPLCITFFCYRNLEGMGSSKLLINREQLTVLDLLKMILEKRNVSHSKNKTYQTRTCAYLSATRIFRSHDRECSQYAQLRVGFKRLNFDRNTRTDYWRPFYGSSSKPSFRHCIWGKFSNR